MTRPRSRKPSRDWTAVWLGGAAAVLLALAAALLSQIHERQMQALRAQAAQTRAQLMAQSIAQNLAQAAAAGIALPKLVGVPEFLQRWHGNHADVTQITVHDAAGRLLWHSQGLDRVDAGRLSVGAADVAPAGAVQARVTLQLHNDSLPGTRQLLGLLVPAVLLFSALAYLGARFACAQGPWLRNHGLRMIARWAARSDYRQLLVLPQRKPFDLRVQEVAHAMRGQHERMMRMRLLIASLRRTEPQQLRRDYLDQILQQVEGHERFADAAPATLRLVAVQSQSLWLALLLCLGAVAPLSYALQACARTADSRWQPALAAACLGLLVLATAAGWKLGARLRMTTLGVLILSQAALLLAPLTLLLGSAPHPGWIAAWNGVFAGAALAACTRAQTHPDTHPGFAHAQPALPGAALLGWWSGLLWLAPALGYYVHAALRPHWAALALLLPMACGLCFALRWDVAHSPWRVRMARAAAPARAEPAWRWSTLGLAGGLATGPLVASLVAAADTAAAPALLQQCALGVGLALVWFWPRRSAPAAPSPWRSGLNAVMGLLALALQLAAAWPLPALPPVAWLAPGLLGMLLGQRLAQAARASQDATSQWLLLGGALGAALSGAALLLGLQGWTPALAWLLLWLAPARARGGHVA